MSFDLNVFAQEFGIDPATLQAKPEVFSKWNGYLTQADAQYKTAKQLKEEADALEKVIQQKIDNFSGTEIERAQQKAYVDSLEAQLASLKQQGFNLTLPAKPEPAKIDPNTQFQNNVTAGLSTMGQILKATTKYQQVYGRPFPDDLDALYNEAVQKRMTVDALAEQKYDFAGEQKRQQEAARKAEIAAEVAKGVTAYKEANPITAGNADLARGRSSMFPELAKRPAVKPHENFGGTPAQRIARSVRRSVEGLAATA